ncbi:putative E3 ubiquitin-protein ligase RING1a isoform X2 [Hevea brasiliensis]|uniref:putative E3 ubiquitin-protein ligase RING1a isoform X2 n=1 Tax=Hevea brasiliensis TaxID=3981 RepID=UPI0025F1DD97|nr:putative E3 ubiquitin-protein ligase RING1a isoform X2 [Hevea brasiliensis]
MPAQKRSLPDNPDNDEEDAPSSPLQNGHQYPKQSRVDPPPLDDPTLHQQQQLEEGEEEDEPTHKPEEEEEEEEEEDAEGEEDEELEEQAEEKQPAAQDSEESQSSSSEDEKPEFVFVELPDIRKDVQCPICLGIIKKTRTVMECLHRFCRECIDKSMRLGNNECPACRTHCASRRSLRDDPNYDALIAALYPDIDKYEEEELAFHEEERTRNKQIQASIAQIFQRQSEALVRRRTMGKETTGPFMERSQRIHRTIPSRRRRNSRGTEFQGSEDIEDENDDNGGKDSSSTDDRSTEVRQRRRKRRPGIRPCQPSSSASNPEAGCIENDLEATRENRGISPGLVWNTEMLAWGRGGARSHTRHGNASSCNNKNARSTRLSKLVEYLRSLEENNDELKAISCLQLDVHLMLISMDNESFMNLTQPYLCCRPSLSVKHLCEYIAHKKALEPEEVEIFLVKGQHNPNDNLSSLHPPISVDELQILKGQETLAHLKANCTSSRDHLILAYRKKETA